MLDLFLGGYQPSTKRLLSSKFEVISKRYATEIDKVITYYNFAVKTLKSQHVLSRMLYTLNVSMEDDFATYMKGVVARTPYLYRNFGVGTAYSKAVPHDSMFYGEDGVELWIGDEETGNIFTQAERWTTLRPVHPITHQNVDLKLSVMETDYRYSFTDLSVVSINLPLLAIQYRMWYKTQEEADTATYIDKFIKQYVLPNMLVPHTDLVVLNRLMDLFYNGSVVLDYNPPKLPISIIDYSDKLDSVLMELLGRINNGVFRYEEFLQIIPGLTNLHIEESLRLPDIPLTKQARMLLMLSRLRYIKFFIDLGGERSLRLNKHHIGDLKRNLMYLRNDALFNDIPFAVHTDYTLMIEEILDL